jgi:hypothetical protein
MGKRKSEPPVVVPVVDTDMPEVRVGACGCVLRADALPIGFRFVATPTGDKRVAVYACAEHTRLTR